MFKIRAFKINKIGDLTKSFSHPPFLFRFSKVILGLTAFIDFGVPNFQAQ